MSRLKNSVLKYGSTFKMAVSILPLLYLLFLLFELVAWLTHKSKFVYFFKSQQCGTAGEEAAVFQCHLQLQQNCQLNPNSRIFVSGEFVIEHEVEKAQIDFLGARRKQRF